MTTVGNAQGALDMLRTGEADVVLCDLGLPGMDGCELARRIRADPAIAGVTPVAVTGYGQPEDRARTAAAGTTSRSRLSLSRATREPLL